MSSPRVLQIGMDPAVIDFSPWPGQDARQLLTRIARAEDALRADGYDVTSCLVTADPDAAERTVRACLAEQPFSAIEIGSGMRTSHEYTAVFERVINIVITEQPGVPLCFNDAPETTPDAVRRALGL